MAYVPIESTQLICAVCDRPFSWSRPRTYCSAECKREKTRLKAQEWRNAHPEKVREIARQSKQRSRAKEGGREHEQAIQSRYYEKNKEAIGQRMRARYIADPNKILARNAKWRAENPEVLRASWARDYAKTAEKRRAYSRAWYASNTDRAKAAQRRWAQENPERLRALKARYGAQKFTAAHESIVPLVVFERDNWNCGICDKKVDKRLRHPHPRSASLDHIIPLSRGGPHLYENVQLAHLSCNCSKKNLGSGDQLLLFG